MAILRKLLALSIALVLIAAHSSANSDVSLKNSQLSLPELVKSDKLPDTWVLGESAVLNEGRLMLTPKKGTEGSLWAKTVFHLQESFTVAWTVRSVNFRGKSPGGLALWFIKEDASENKNLFNGPDHFDGLQLLIDDNSEIGATLRGNFGDGTETMTNQDIYSHTFASCLMAYQDSSVPLTIRLTYVGSDDRLLKLQVDNKVCFQSTKIQFPLGDYKVGATASNANTEESFEILKMDFYDGPIKESFIPNVKELDQPRLITKVINQKTGHEELVEKSPMEISGGDAVSNFDLFKKLNRIEGKILANDIGELLLSFEKVLALQKEQAHRIDQIIAKIASSDGHKGQISDMNTDETFSDFFKVDQKLQQLLEEQQRVKELSKKNGGQDGLTSGPHIDEIVRKLSMWLVPLVVIMMVMAYYTFRIRQDIVKAKLL
ncbi:LAMI_0G17612g1_1 [Lachancea mirantina]|uniref:LAMI_0G17612g1_1 n=1 Tax=Lachancea mirantina TaxID=1230905 RepID=A0A1G4KD15_9SACH|nr:LAMI_0G17612g1_1 [Lachancea mirantina]